MTNNKLFLWLITWRIVRTSDLIKKARAHWIYMHVRAFMHLCKICAWKCPWYANDSKCIVAYYDIWEVNSALIILYFYFLYKSSSTNILRIFYRKNERRKVIDKIREKRKMTLQRWLKISMTKTNTWTMNPLFGVIVLISRFPNYSLQ